MKEISLKQYVVDAFTDQVFKGNPAAVCVLDEWPSDDLMLAIARENNLSETAFTVKEGEKYGLRWFTPGGEIDLCGHATLGTAFVLLNFVEKGSTRVTFRTQSGELIVNRKGDLYEMDMPAYTLKEVPVTDDMTAAIGAKPVEAWMARDLVCVMEDQEQVKSATPDKDRLMKLDGLLLHLTARGSEFDCVTRSFAPKLNVQEDPVCGSGHCHVIPLWAEKLHKDDLVAFQASRRSGVLYCKLTGDRIFMAGKAKLYSEATIHVPADI